MRRPSLSCIIREDRNIAGDVAKQGIMASVWVVLARNSDDLELAAPKVYVAAGASASDVKAWTDDYSNLLQVFRWGAAE